MKHIGTYADVPVSLDQRDGQELIVFTIPCDLLGTPSWYAIHGLGNAVGCGTVSSCAISGGDVRVELPYTDEVDHRIMTLIDLLITARYEQPTMVQLSLCLDPTEVHRLEAVLS